MLRRLAVVIGVVAAGIAARAQQPTVRAPVDTVEVDVRATGRDGKIVRDLTAKDFEIKEDGKRQAITAISLIDLQEEAAPSSAAAVNDHARVYVMVLDDLHVTAQSSARVKRIAMEFIDHSLADRDVMVIRLTGSTVPATAITSDKAILKAAVTAFIGRKPPSASADESERRERGGDARATMVALRESSESVREWRGRRKAIVMISEGIESEVSDSEGAIRSANETHTSCYTIDPRGLAQFDTADITAPTIDPENVADTPRASVNGQSSLRWLSESTGGAFINQANLTAAFNRIVDDITTHYLISYAAPAGAKPGYRKIVVNVKRRGVQVRARPGYFSPQSRPSPMLTTAAAPASLASNEAATPPVEAAPPPVVDEEIKDETGAASLPLVLTRLAKYVTEYQTRLGGIVVEEDYRQRVTAESIPGRGSAVPPAIELKSDLLLVRPEGEDRWIQFRDVFQVDGRMVRDRDERLYKLFITPTGTTQQQAQAIQNEGARYNVGSLIRTVNVPILALAFFDAANQPRFTFRRIKPGDVREFAGSAKPDDVWAIEYKEVAKQTLVRGNNNIDMPSRGRIWIEGTTGRVLKTELNIEDIQVKAAITVDYTFAPELSLLVPSEMRERYQMLRSSSKIEATATYSKFRQFKVTTTEKQKPPPDDCP